MNSAWLLTALGCMALGALLVVIVATMVGPSAIHTPNGYDSHTGIVRGNGHPAPIQCRWHVVSYRDAGSYVTETCNE